MSIKKESVISLLIILMILSIIGSFTLFFMGYYKTALTVGGIFMFIATFLSQWSGDKGADYVFRNEHENNRNKWNNK